MAALPRALAFAVPPVVTREQAARLQQLDARIQRVVVPPGGHGVADFSSGVPAQLIVLAAAAPGAVSVNITLCARDGTPVRTKEAVPFDAASGEVIVACRDYYVMDETLPRAATFQVEATGPGGERTTRKFDVDHVLPV
ncbi:MAG TPA: hypothetical protein VHM19_21065 [Polyangiales bacterium]|nr:hypothetical protein [Polyangiales bacterium]